MISSKDRYLAGNRMLLYDVTNEPLERPIEEITRVAYSRSVTGDPLHLNILRPAEPAERPRPVMVWIHGGGWGWRGIDDTYLQGAYVNYPFALEGYFTVAVEYTLSARAPFPAQIHDCKAAIRWLRAHSEEYNIDRDRIAVWGRSAGGHLCALLGTSGEAAELEGNGGWSGFSSQVNAVIDYFGPTDLTALAGTHNGEKEAHVRNLLRLLLGGSIEERLALARTADPMHYIAEGSPPFLIIHGDSDLPVPFSQSEALHKALASRNAPSILVRVSNAGHGLLPDKPDASIDPTLPELHEQIRRFLTNHLLT